MTTSSMRPWRRPSDSQDQNNEKPASDELAGFLILGRRILVLAGETHDLQTQGGILGLGSRRPPLSGGKLALQAKDALTCFVDDRIGAIDVLVVPASQLEFEIGNDHCDGPSIFDAGIIQKSSKRTDPGGRILCIDRGLSTPLPFLPDDDFAQTALGADVPQGDT